MFKKITRIKSHYSKRKTPRGILLLEPGAGGEVLKSTHTPLCQNFFKKFNRRLPALRLRIGAARCFANYSAR